MKLKDVEALVDQNPARRAMQMLMLGSELKVTKPKKPPKPTTARMMMAESVMGHQPAVMLASLLGVAQEKPHEAAGLKSTGRTLKTASGKVDDLVFTARERKKTARQAMTRSKGTTVEDLAVRQLGVGMMESDPHARVCAAYAYWQATGWKEPVMPILANAIESSDFDERELGATCLARIDPKKIRKLQGTAKDDKPNTPIQPVKASMTVLIHGTFAKGFRLVQTGRRFPPVHQKECVR